MKVYECIVKLERLHRLCWVGWGCSEPELSRWHPQSQVKLDTKGRAEKYPQQHTNPPQNKVGTQRAHWVLPKPDTHGTATVVFNTGYSQWGGNPPRKPLCCSQIEIKVTTRQVSRIIPTKLPLIWSEISNWISLETEGTNKNERKIRLIMILHSYNYLSLYSEKKMLLRPGQLKGSFICRS